jgi:hypothetical protein
LLFIIVCKCPAELEEAAELGAPVPPILTKKIILPRYHSLFGLCGAGSLQVFAINGYAREA